MKIIVNEFRGIQPKVANDKLPANMAQVAMDCITSTGEIRAIKRSTADVLLSGSSYKSFFEYLSGGSGSWVYFDGVVFAARSPVADDTFERMYYMGESGASAIGTITFTDGMTDGEYITINTTTFEFDIDEDGDDATTGYNQIGDATTVNKELCAAELASQTIAGITLTDNGDGTVTVTYDAHGTAGNAISLVKSGDHIAVSAATLAGGTADGLYKAFSNDIDSTPWDFTVDFYLPGSTAGVAPTLVPTAGTDYVAYYYTYVSRYGEEGPGSAIAESALHTDGSVCQVNAIATPPSGHGLLTTVGTNKPLVRVYRTATDGTGGAEFLLAAEADYFAEGTTYVAGDYTIYDNKLYHATVGGTGTWAGGTHTWVLGDITTDADLGTTGDSYLWRSAPANLTNLRSHPNGFFVASKDNEIHFSEPFAPWAWPEDYVIPIDAEVVGIGIFSSTIVVATDANIYTFSGPHPDSLYKQRLAFQPCLSQRAVVETDLGVMFPSAEGFQLVASDSAPQNVTRDWFQPSDWDDLELTTMHGVWYNKAYYGFYKSADYEGGIIIDFVNNAITTVNDYHYASHVAVSDGAFRTIKNSSIAAPTSLYISRWNNNPSIYRNYRYKSPRYILGRLTNIQVAQIILDTEWYNDMYEDAGGDLETLNQSVWDETDWGYQLGGCINGYVINDLGDGNGDALYDLSTVGLQDYVDFNVYVDGVLTFSKQVSDCKAFKLPRGFKNKIWEWEVIGMIPIKRVTLASTMEELKDG